MPIRWAIWVGARPVFVPLATAAVGFYFGTYDLVYLMAGVLIRSPDTSDLKPISKILSIVGGMTAGSSIILLRHYMFKPPPFALPMTTATCGTTIGKIKAAYSNLRTSLRSLKGFPYAYYALTIVGSASIAGVATAILQKNMEVKKNKPIVAANFNSMH